MKKVLFLIGSLDMGGAEKVLVDTANMMVENGYDITVQTIMDQGPLKFKLDSRVHYRTIIKTKNRYIRSIKLKLWAKIIPPKYVYNRYVKQDYDYEVAFLEGFSTKIISASNNSKYAWVHINLMNSFASVADYKSFDECKNAYSKFDKIFCVSEDVKDGFVERFGEMQNVEVKYNYVNAENIIKQSKEKTEDVEEWDKTILNLVSVGNLHDRKAQDRLVKIAKQLKDEGHKFVIRIVGDGPNKGKLNDLINDLDVADCVKLLGMKENPFPYIANSDLFVCSSLEEGFSTVVTESFILGVPVITTDCSGMKEQFAGYDCGKIVSNKEDELSYAIKDYFENEETRNIYKEGAYIRSKQFVKRDELEKILSLFT